MVLNDVIPNRCNQETPGLHDDYEPHTHLELLNSSLQPLGGEAGLFGRQLILRCLKPPEEGAGEAAELKQLLLAGLDGSKSE